MRLFRRKPGFTHPCPICQRAGRVYPHGGQHAVRYAPATCSGTLLPVAPSRTAAEALDRLGLSLAEFREQIMRDR